MRLASIGLRRGSPVLIEVLGKESACLAKNSVHMVRSDHFVKEHGNILVVQLSFHDVVPVLEQASQAQEHEERVPVAKLGRWRKSITIDGQGVELSQVGQSFALRRA